MFRSCGRLLVMRRATGTVPLAGASSSAAAALAMLTQHRCLLGGDSKNPYTILGIKQGATKEQIKKAHRVMARKHHPDAPGGSHEKFQEIQNAYEEIKTGVWVQKNAGGGGDGAANSGNRYSNFRYTTRGHKSKVTYDDFYAEMHGGGKKKNSDFDDEDLDLDAKKKARRNPMAGNERLVQAWFRVIVIWTAIFCTMRVTLFLLFPPKHHTTPKKPLPEKPRKPLPPKPLSTQPVLA